MVLFIPRAKWTGKAMIKLKYAITLENYIDMSQCLLEPPDGTVRNIATMYKLTGFNSHIGTGNAAGHYNTNLVTGQSLFFPLASKVDITYCTPLITYVQLSQYTKRDVQNQRTR
jgi:hypothetical protein